MRVAMLNVDITAAALAMDAADGEGYPADYIIGPAGSTVQVIDDEDTHWVEVEGFANDPYAAGFVLRADLDWPSD